MKALFILILLSLTTATFAQKAQIVTYVGVEPIDAESVAPWVVKQFASYAGIYHFGMSEWESEFELKVAKGIIVAVDKHYHISVSGKPKLIIRRFTHVRIVGRRFYSDQTNGEFVSFIDEKKLSYGLKIYPSWNFNKQEKAAEIGIRVM